ncbi:peptidoglycan/LPS O-acetylase OafA/YrhL [Novosphingobium chloroacetimidivorans]|uniref:Peptidoglycan/LPS O-acetylase OafA/YrhL n=1 Tax=Novosphingobium chloroacetimidivorans TaxID=1428314 RepID=A0A7W7KCX0_9SPHN|nr:acyltransferase [Novosphingobium chloroacetimidivorans]MBB4859918.1 peptidoglycan/LPS O-acetylase OafA/YrhL [Novosphingobium chloroacetimidivorans]
MTTNTSRITYIDGLRFIAAAMVVLQHYFEHRTGVMTQVVRTLQPGVAGVALFFFVSGFIIPFSVTRGFNPIDFAIRRVSRIYPLYLVCLVPFAFYQVTGLGLAARPTFDAVRWIAALLLVSEYVGEKPIIGAAWTLPLEFLWYGLFAVFITTCRTGVARRLERAIVGVTLITLVVTLATGVRIPAGRIFMLYAAVIGYKAFLLTEGEMRLRHFLASVALFVLLLVPSFYLAFQLHSHARVGFAQALYPWLFGLTLFLLVVLIPRARASPLLCNPIAAYLGAISYSVYLVHGQTYDAIRSVVPSAWAVPLSMTVTLLLASLTYRLVERSGIDLGRAMSGRIKHRAPTLTVCHA